VSWNTVALDEVISLQNGYAFKSSEYSHDGYFLMRITNVQQGFIQNNNPKFVNIPVKSKLEQFILNEGDILISLTGDVGRVGIIKEENLPAALNQRVARVTIKSSLNLDKRYLFLLLNSEEIRKQIESKGHGAAQLNVSTKDILSIEIPLPPIATQKKIVTKLDALLAEIDKATAAAEANAKNAEALFQSYMSKVFNECENTFGTSELSSICDLQNGYAFKSADYVDLSNTLNIRMSSIRPGGFFDAEHNKRYLPDSYAVKYKDFLLNDGDLVIAMTDMAGDPKILGVPTIVKDLKERMFLMNQRVGKIHKFSDLIDVSYLRYFLTSPKLKEFYKSKGDGGLQINISKKDILSANIPIPPIQTQKSIGKDMSFEQENSEKLRFSYLRKAGELKSLKQSILTQAFNGELLKE